MHKELKISINCTTIILLLFVSCIRSMCQQAQFTRATLCLIEIYWNDNSGNTMPVSDTLVFNLKSGNTFGSKNHPYSFRLIEIENQNSVKISYSGELMIAGNTENLKKSDNTVFLNSTKTCFRSADNKTGYYCCLKVLAIK